MPQVPDRSAISAIDRLISARAEIGRDYLLEDDAYRILRLIGFDTPEFIRVTGIEDLRAADLGAIPGEKVVCKLLSPDIPHRSEAGGIRFVEKKMDRLEEAVKGMKAAAGRLKAEFSGVLLSEFLDIREYIPWQLLISLRQDRSFGPVVTVGLGGTGTEVYREGLKDEKGLLIRTARNFLEKGDNGKYLGSTMFYPIISGSTRISRTAAIDPALIDEALRKIAYTAESFSPFSGSTGCTIEEFEINPLQITDDGRLVPLDALVRVSSRKSSESYPPREKIDRLLRPEKILVIGASASRMNMGRTILKNLVSEDGGIGREAVSLLHPEAEEIDGCRAYRSLADLPGKIDMTVFTIPASEAAVSLVEEIISSGASESIVLISGGFGEVEGGRHLAVRIRDAVSGGRRRGDGGTVVNGPNCMGIMSRPGRYNTFFLPEYKLSFDGRFGERVAVISQSGAWLVTIVSTLSEIFSPRYMISVGNQIDITVTDYLINLKDDPEIDIFCLYLEGFKPGGGRRFLDVSREIIASGKKILVYKTGRTAEGAKAAASHTAAMASDHDVFKKLLAEEGIYQASSLEDIEDAVKCLSLLNGRKVRGNRVGICSDAGYECSVAADRLGSMALARFAEGTVSKLHGALPTGIVDIHNPIDTTPAITTAGYGKCIEAMIEDPNTDCVVVSNVAATPLQENLERGPGHDEDITREGSHPNTLIRIFHSTDKPMVVCMNEGRIYDAAVRMMERSGIPVFRKIDRAMDAMNIFLRVSRSE